jgi:hypothetical protein
MNTTYICPFCNRDVKVTAPPNKAEDRWDELKSWLKKHPNQIHYMGAATIESVVKKMEELEEK